MRCTDTGWSFSSAWPFSWPGSLPRQSFWTNRLPWVLRTTSPRGRRPSTLSAHPWQNISSHCQSRPLATLPSDGASHRRLLAPFHAGHGCTTGAPGCGGDCVCSCSVRVRVPQVREPSERLTPRFGSSLVGETGIKHVDSGILGAAAFGKQDRGQDGASMPDSERGSGLGDRSHGGEVAEGRRVRPR
jgi:hypothetical protein